MLQTVQGNLPGTSDVPTRHLAGLATKQDGWEPVCTLYYNRRM
jgi:hypothetical protein